MKFLVDQNLSPRVAVELRHAGPDALHTRDLGLAEASDTEILDRAADEDRVVVSAQTDFGAILAGRRTSKPSVILIRRSSNRRGREIAQLILANLAEAADELEDGAVVVFESGRLRIRRLPLV